MNKSVKFLLISLGGLSVMIIVGMTVAYFAGVDESKLNELDLAKDWLVYRIAIYLLIIGLWPQLSRYLTKPRFNVDDLVEEERQKFEVRRENDIVYLKKQWWKIAGMFVFFEVVMIQQLGF